MKSLSAIMPLSVGTLCLLMICVLPLLSGCCGWDALSFRSQSPEPSPWSFSEVNLVGDMAVPFGMFPIEVGNVALVTGLDGTGSDPVPGSQRARLLDELQTRKVDKPNQLLASDSTAMALIRCILPPGVQKGDRLDFELRVPSRSETTSLAGGWVMPVRLKEMRVLDGQFRDGHLMAFAKGAVLVDPGSSSERGSSLAGRGRVLGGAVATKSRPLGLVLKPGFQNVKNSSEIATAINKRFHTFRNGVKVGMAKAKDDKFIELQVHPEYKENVQRYMQVVRALAVRESSVEHAKRMSGLKERLLDPKTSTTASLQLEAIGTEAGDVLCEGIKSDDAEVRFHAAEALAFIDRHEAAEPLAEAVKKEPAFRVFALAALSTMDGFEAYGQLRDLLSAPSAETRYGAFRALWAMNPNDALVLGEDMEGKFSYHVLDTAGPKMIHVTRSHRPEVVVFGRDQHLATPLAVNAGNKIMVTSTAAGEISVSKFAVGMADQKRTVSTEIDEVIRAIVELGGTYADVVQALQEANTAGILPGRFEVDALPEAGRKYDRVASVPSGSGGGDAVAGGSEGEDSQENTPETAENEDSQSSVSGFFARMGRGLGM